MVYLINKLKDPAAIHACVCCTAVIHMAARLHTLCDLLYRDRNYYTTDSSIRVHTCACRLGYLKDPAATCAWVCNIMQVRGKLGRKVSNHLRLASLHHRQPFCCYHTTRSLGPGIDSQSWTCHTLLHFVTLFNTFLSCQPHPLTLYAWWGDLFHTL